MAAFADDGVMITQSSEPAISVMAGTLDAHIVQVTRLYCGGPSSSRNRNWDSCALVVHVSRLYVAGVYRRIRQ